MEYCCFPGAEFRFGNVRKVLETDSGNRRTTLGMSLMSLNCTLKNG